MALHLVTISGFYFALGIALLAGSSWAAGALGSVVDSLSGTPVYVGQLALGIGLVLISFRYDPKPRAERMAARFSPLPVAAAAMESWLLRRDAVGLRR